jgi:hypothetical protein
MIPPGGLLLQTCLQLACESIFRQGVASGSYGECYYHMVSAAAAYTKEQTAKWSDSYACFPLWAAVSTRIGSWGQICGNLLNVSHH